jgi:hypothetical protein
LARVPTSSGCVPTLPPASPSSSPAEDGESDLSEWGGESRTRAPQSLDAGRTGSPPHDSVTRLSSPVDSMQGSVTGAAFRMTIVQLSVYSWRSVLLFSCCRYGVEQCCRTVPTCSRNLYTDFYIEF